MMNHATRTMPAPGSRAFVDALATGLLRLVSALRRKYEKRAAERRRDRAIAVTIRELSRLDDRILRDIGIDRGDIQVIAIALADNPNVNVREIGNR